jgi:hypothetical protein
MGKKTVKWQFLAAALVAIAGFLLVTFTPRKILSDPDASNIRATWQNAEIPADPVKLLEILKKYEAVATLDAYLPYETKRIDLEISLMDDREPKHILLGEFNVWYGDGGTYVILNVEQLKGELETLLAKKFHKGAL